jgi:homocysteine S-methyltransferase
VILDGAGGTELERRGYREIPGLWSAGALRDAPDLVVRIHREYLAAGAQVITTQTFNCARRRFRKAGLEALAEPLTKRAVELARRAREEAGRPEALVAGGLSPLEQCYHPERAPRGDEAYREHREMATYLAEAGADLLLVETMNTAEEARVALAAARTTGLEVVVGFVCARDGRLLSGEPLAAAVGALDPLGPTAYAVNCTPVPLATRALAELRGATRVPFGIYANVGDWQGTWAGVFGAEFVFPVEPESYLQHAISWRQLGASFIGGCCGTTPEHIRRLGEAFLRRPGRDDPGA